MAKIRNGLYVPEERDVQQGKFVPDSSVSGQRFEPDGSGGGILYVTRRRFKPGFRKPVEERIAIRKECHLSPAADHGDDERRDSHGR